MKLRRGLVGLWICAVPLCVLPGVRAAAGDALDERILESEALVAWETGEREAPPVQAPATEELLDEATGHTADAFIVLDIPLPAELQAYCWRLCEEYGVPVVLLLAVMEQESGWNPKIPDNVNPNGSRDRGLMQINSCMWGILAEAGVDVSTPKGNIEAGVMILAGYLEKYPAEQALVAYNCGEGAMLRQGLVSTGYSQKVLQRQAALEQLLDACCNTGVSSEETRRNDQKEEAYD